VETAAVFTTRELVKPLLALADFNCLVRTGGEADTPVEALMEVSFYAMLALLNLVQGGGGQ
jgi:hypothetical protein